MIDSKMLEQLSASGRALLPELTELRHELHRHPEIGLDLPLTQATVLAALEGLGLEVTLGRTLTSVVAVLRGGRPGPAVLLRGDMDALPVTENSGEEFTSQIPGVMHACGHDLHTAGLVGAARLLADRRADLAGSVVFMFQPGEEGDHGAKLMIDEGVLDAAGERVVAAYGLHVGSAVLPSGLMSSRPGPMLAAADTVLVRIDGRGGHGSAPHLAADPVPVAAEIVLAVQSMVTRQFDAFDPVVVSIGLMQAGTVGNVIPGTATLEATVRTVSEASHHAIEERLIRLCTGIAAAHGLTAAVDYQRGYPATINDPGESDRAAATARAIFGPDSFVTAPTPILGAEDFSYVLQQVPGAFVALGATPPDADPATAPFNHAPDARFHDGALAVGPGLLAGLAMSRLAQG